METADVKDEEVAGAQPTREECRERHGAGAIRGNNDGLLTIMRAKQREEDSPTLLD